MLPAQLTKTNHQESTREEHKRSSKHRFIYDVNYNKVKMPVELIVILLRSWWLLDRQDRSEAVKHVTQTSLFNEVKAQPTL